MLCFSSLFPSLMRAEILSGLGMAQGSNSPDLDCYVEKHSEAQSWLRGKECCDRLIMSAMGRGLQSVICAMNLLFLIYSDILFTDGEHEARETQDLALPKLGEKCTPLIF